MVYAHKPVCLPVDKAKGASLPDGEPGTVPEEQQQVSKPKTGKSRGKG